MTRSCRTCWAAPACWLSHMATRCGRSSRTWTGSCAPSCRVADAWTPILAGDNDPVRVVTEQALGSLLSRLDNVPRIVIGGKFATPWPALGVLDKALGR